MVGHMKRWFAQVLFAILVALVPVVVHATIFDDGNDRKLVKELQAKDSATLTDEEKAILAAANKVGAIGLCNGKEGANAFLIRFNSRPAVITNAHAFVSGSTGEVLCRPAEDMNAALYMPNHSYYDASHPKRDKDFVYRTVRLEAPPVNWDLIKTGYGGANDFAIFYLMEDITQDRMPDGTLRGYLKFGETEPSESGMYLLGLAPDLGGAVELLYQQRCDGHWHRGELFHSCDTIPGSSGSLIATLEEGELRFRAIHAGGGSGKEALPPPERRYHVLNRAAPSDNVRTLSEAAGSPDDLLYIRPYETAYSRELNWVLEMAGCHSGESDGQWGPESRKALAAFASATQAALPGTEPSVDLLAAVKKAATNFVTATGTTLSGTESVTELLAKAARDGTKVCR